MQMFCMFALLFWHLSLINTCTRIPTCMRCPQDLHTPCNAHTRYRSHHVQQSQSHAKTRCQPCQPVLNRIMAHYPLGICPSSQEPDSVMSLSPLVSAIEPSESSKSSTSTVCAESPHAPILLCGFESVHEPGVWHGCGITLPPQGVQTEHGAECHRWPCVHSLPVCLLLPTDVLIGF